MMLVKVKVFNLQRLMCYFMSFRKVSTVRIEETTIEGIEDNTFEL